MIFLAGHTARSWLRGIWAVVPVLFRDHGARFLDGLCISGPADGQDTCAWTSPSAGGQVVQASKVWRYPKCKTPE